jgi:dihydrofolate synthase / folylpolyglutamate synthase
VNRSSANAKRSLAQWLAWQEQLHPQTIELGLERAATVLARLGIESLPMVQVTVAGTNGKGSSVAMLAAIWQAAGYRIGCYTSPHIHRYNERITLNGVPVSDALLCDAFSRIEAVRGDVSLTYFEFGTLAALLIFAEAELDGVILETGMGGRLDATNLLAADVALITAIDLDHQQWLGDTREAIGREKAGIMRSGRRAICSDPSPPQTLIDHAAAIAAPLMWPGHGFDFHAVDSGLWRWQMAGGAAMVLPLPALAGPFQIQNGAGVVAVIEALQSRLPVSCAAIASGLQQVHLAGRFALIQQQPLPIWVDVAHNPQSARALAAILVERPIDGCNFALFSLLKDKPLTEVVAPLAAIFSHWWVIGLEGTRGRTAAELAVELAPLVSGRVIAASSAAAALDEVAAVAAKGDRLIAFGSFHTVAAVEAALAEGAGQMPLSLLP